MLMLGYVYVLRMSSGKYYVGSTKDIKRRLHEHYAGQVRSTAPYLPLELLKVVNYPTYTQARSKELWLKKQKSRKSIENFLTEEIDFMAL